jgi:xanthine dehydrogenase accessory factor
MSLEVLGEAARRLRAGRPVVLATLVATRGSTPQKAPARLVLSAGGAVVGTVGGGAVEAAVIHEAQACLEDGGLALREHALSGGTDEWGLACAGSMLVLTERLGETALPWLDRVLLADAGEPVAVVTVLEGAGAGSRLVVLERPDDGGGESASTRDADLRALGRRVLARETAEVATLEGVRVHAEPFGPQPALVVAGAGHVGKALAALGRFLGLRVTVVDDRPEYASRERFPEAHAVIAGPVDEALARAGATSRTAIVVAMRSQDLDHAAVFTALGTPARYVGLVGSRRKAMQIAERLAADGMPPDRIRALRSPVGLDLGARTPEEIAVAILGEWLMLRQGGSGAPLRLDDGLVAEALARGDAGGGPSRG